MTGLEFFLMSLFTVIGIKYIIDMIKYAKGYEINGKTRYGKKYARELEKKDTGKKQMKKEEVKKCAQDIALHEDISGLISALKTQSI